MIADFLEEASAAEWGALYDAAEATYALAPWEWMYDSELLAVRDPESGEIAYCCVMGILGEHYAVAAYLGDEGLRGYRRIESGEFEHNPGGAIHIQRCISASFEDRELLEKRDREVIRSLGRSYRGRSAWPMFRDYTPGLHPWHLAAPQVRLMTAVLTQVCEVARRVRDEPGLLDAEAGEPLLLRTSEGGAWRDATTSAQPPPPAPPPPARIDELRIERLRRARPQVVGVWELDITYTPQPVQERRSQRPYYPHLLLVVDGVSGMVLAPQLSSGSDWRDAMVAHLIDLCEQARVVPSQIVVRDEPMRQLIEPAMRRLGARVRVSRQLPALDHAYQSMRQHFSDGG